MIHNHLVECSVENCSVDAAEGWKFNQHDIPQCHHNVDQLPGWSDIAFLPEGDFIIQWCSTSKGWHIFRSGG